MNVAVSNRVIARNNFGQFIRDCEQAAEKTVKESIDRGAKLSRDLAPAGNKTDSRTPKLKDSIKPEMLSRTSGVWKCTARHALPVETGSVPHEITGDVLFFWEREGRWWNPGDNIINHPGNAAQPYLRPAYDIVSREMMNIARRNYPG